jgi:glycosyltransferase involved in cell wall biosynthesis
VKRKRVKESNSPVRILQVIHTFPPYSEAGSENYTRGLSQALHSLGHEIAVCHRIADSTQDEFALTEATFDALPIYRINNTFRFCDRFELTYRNANVDARFGTVLDRFHPDVVHFHHLTCLSTGCVFEAKQRGLPVVMTLHDYWLICQRGQFLRRDDTLSLCQKQEDRECVRCWAPQLDIPESVVSSSRSLRRIFRRVQNRFSRIAARPEAQAVTKVHARMSHVHEVCEAVDLFISPSRFLREQFIAFGVPAHKVLFSSYGYPTTLFPHYDRPASAGQQPIRFAFIGTLIPPKGVHLLIEAFRMIPDSAAQLTIYGGEVLYEGFPDYGKMLRASASSCAHIRFAGAYRQAEVSRILREVDVLIVPSIWYENAPLTIQEAFLAKIPVITSDFGGMGEMVHDGENGLLFRPRDPLDLRRKIQRLIQQPELIRQFGNAHPPVKTIEADASDMVERYARLCQPA